MGGKKTSKGVKRRPSRTTAGYDIINPSKGRNKGLDVIANPAGRPRALLIRGV